MENQIMAAVLPHIRNLLRPGISGEILLVSSGGVYLRFGEKILLLCDENWGCLPIGIGVADYSRTVALLGLQQGQPVTVQGDCLSFPGGRIHLTLQQIPNCLMTNTSPHIGYIRQAAEELASLHRERGLSMLVLPLILGQAPEEATKKNPYCVHGCLWLEKLMAALDHGSRDEIHSCVEKLLGLGPGLTPSADDILLGMVYVLRSLPRKAPEGAGLFQEYIVQLCDRCTNQISAAYLKAIAAGAPFERMERVFAGLCGEETLDIGKLTQIGGSSGSEMLLGMLLALKICGYDVSQMEESK